ncbi:MAG: UDP-N-acetylglucosamine--N-acetylmuramyl-(pentapeptide) pyrophosphoryl-undecaprenol N-acetylglucosamine transferase [Methanoregula sp. SKADARSKE-2]|nr:MAG: UDP-N-acetylglucosamine--N-acetylmuramyl-(pentapeptide) pyrophosphoryl-undecaprenol N-acetylglucosamine transferase [Methanoregula sp. SKADARSKE-2]
MNPLVIRADAGPVVGTGHVMRCLALAEAWQECGGKVILASVSVVSALDVRLKEKGIEVAHIFREAGSMGDAEETIRIAKKFGADWIVIDGYSFGADYQRSIRNAGFYQLFIDDYGHADHYCADIVLNQNIYASRSLYPAHEQYTHFFLGTDYVLLRKEFLNLPRQDREIPEVAQKLLITLGGCDPENITLAIIETIKSAEIPDLHIVVVVGGANPHTKLIDQAVSGHPHFTVLRDAGNMPELMAWADVAISAGGGTCWELLFMGVPSIVIPIAGNQELVARKLGLRSLACVLSESEAKKSHLLAKTLSRILCSREIRSGLSKRMAGYIDGNGPARIIHAMETPALILRTAEPGDCEMVWRWINDPDVRLVSFTQEPIPLDHHRAWFASSLSDPGLIYYLALEPHTGPIGQARFRIENRDATISVLVAPGQRGKSLGSQLIHDATEKVFAETSVENVKAFIKTGNEVSKKAFARAGYLEHGLVDYYGEDAFLFIKKRVRS